MKFYALPMYLLFYVFNRSLTQRFKYIHSECRFPPIYTCTTVTIAQGIETEFDICMQLYPKYVFLKFVFVEKYFAYNKFALLIAIF